MTKRQQAAARRYVRENWSLMWLHYLYCRWMLPTKTLAPLYLKRRR